MVFLARKPSSAIEDPMRIIADSSEPSDIVAALASEESVEVESDNLGLGKYLIGSSVVVERKTGREFRSLLLHGGVGEQAFRMSVVYRRAIWIIEGKLYDGRDNLDACLITRALSHLALVEGSTVLRVESRAETIDILISMAKRLQERPYQVPLRATKPQDPRALAEFIVSGLPGVGPVRARILLEHFGSVRRLFRADPEEIAAIRGFGPKTAAAIRRALDYWYLGNGSDR